MPPVQAITRKYFLSISVGAAIVYHRLVLDKAIVVHHSHHVWLASHTVVARGVWIWLPENRRCWEQVRKQIDQAHDTP